MAGTAVMPQTNGLPLEKPMQISEMISEMAQFDKILKLRDEVFAGTHPRLKLKSAPESLPDVPSVKPQASAAPVKKLSNGVNKDEPKPSTVSSPATNDQIRSSNANAAPLKAPPQQPRQFQQAVGSSGIDPIFLTKSDDLIRAEIRLERQRVERTLEEQSRQYNRAQRQREIEQEMIPKFDISEVLEQAQQLVKPLAASEIQTAKASGSPPDDSLDDNTFYSSQVNESTAEDADEHLRIRASKPCKYFFKGKCVKGNACPNSHDPAFKKNLQTTESLTITADSFEADNDIRPAREQWRRTSAAEGVRLRGSPDYNSAREPGEIEESSYSPPHIQAQAANRRPRRDQPLRTNNEKESRRQDNHPPSRYPKRRRNKYSPEDGQIVRNHITSPLAPQPARVSPLAVAKAPRLENIRQDDFQERSLGSARQPGSGQQSPIVTQVPLSRKRRREQELNDYTRNVAPRRDFPSPVPYIKDEPMTPPSLNDHSAMRYQGEEETRSPILVRNGSPRTEERFIYNPLHSARQYVDEPELRRIASPAVRRIVSGPGGTHEGQREPELRRIVSARQALRAASPQPKLAYYSTNPGPIASRAISHSHASPAEMNERRTYRASAQPQPLAYAASDRGHSPTIRTVQYSPAERESRPMGPPPRRIVFDQQGNRYYEAPMPSERQGSVLIDPRYVNEISEPGLRRASVRPEAAARIYSDGTYVQRLSPEPPSPRYIEYRSAPIVRAVSRAPQYEPREDGYRPQAEAVRVVDYPYQRVLDRYEGPIQAPRMHSLAPSYHAYPDDQYEIRPREERSYRAPTLQPETLVTSARYVPDSRENGIVRHASVRVNERELAPAREEYLEMAPKPRYQYVPAQQGYPEREYERRGSLLEQREDERPLRRL